MKNIIKFLFFPVFLFTCCFVAIDGCLYAQDKVIAVVNNDIITQNDLTDFLHFMRLQYSRQLQGKALEEKVDSMKRDLLQRLIEDRLILQQAKLEKAVLDPSRVKNKIDEVRKRYSSEADFEQDLAKQGLVLADLENKISEQMLMYNFIEGKIRHKVVIRPDEITSFYNQNKGQFLKPEERVLTLVILQDEAIAKTVSYQLRLGTKLEDLAAKYAFTIDKFSALAGQQLRPEIEGTVFKLGIGEVSNPIKIDGQYFIFKLNEILGSQQLSLTQAQDKIQAYLFEQKMQEALVKWLDEIKKQSYIKIFEN
ncbi:MAG TPA: peptidyl-prolyl cis-trans isomerase [Candidatus Omnitrophota bacterium]|nr:peptidyl-prolyl cis-trans isomerase [Candidatus Omnitrophota bacterium]HPT39251.1 peptidyl-prolyl cis-trans isomerase [Candidatus Omnitrophota bacterium]